MSNPAYIGIRVEVATRIVPMKNLLKKYNSKHTETQLFDLFMNGKITVERNNGLIIARGAKSDKGPTGLINFALMAKLDADRAEIERITEIINVLGNDRLIRERVFTFVTGHSVLISIPELLILQTAMNDLDVLLPGFIKTAWYYAPEAIF
jgi:hypothetical protein